MNPAAGDAGQLEPAKPKPSRHRPLTQRELINKLMRIAQPSRPSRSSVQLSRGPRGQVLIDVNIHQGDEPGLNSVAAVQARAVEVFEELRVLYPISIDTSGAGGVS